MSESGLLETVGRLYEAATDAAKLQRVGLDIAREFGTDSAIVFLAKRRSTELVQLISTTANFDGSARSAYGGYYHKRNEWYLRGARHAPPFSALGGELIDYPSFDRTEFCNDWCSRVGIYHLLAATFPIDEEVVGAIGIHRPRRAVAFDREQKRQLTALVPHLARTLQIARKLAITRRADELTLQVLYSIGIGLVLVDADCRILFMSSIAEEIVHTSQWLTLSCGKILPVQHSAVSAFARAVWEAANTSGGSGITSGQVIRLRDRYDTGLPALITPFRSVSLEFLNVQPTAAIILNKPQRRGVVSPAVLSRVFELTAAEGRLLAALLLDRSLSSYAESACISINTARTQLKSVFLKLGCSRQSELISAVLANPILQIPQAK